AVEAAAGWSPPAPADVIEQLARPAAASNDVAEPGEPLATLLFAVVAEKTGYPVESLGLDMGLDADLGIDSIKRVEILAALQERLPGAVAIGGDQLGTLRTLADVIAAVGRPRSNPPTVMIQGSPDVESVLLQAVAEKTGYPCESLGLHMALDAD